MLIDWETAAKYGGEAALRARVSAFTAALESHKATADVPPPTEEWLVDRLARKAIEFTVEASPPPRDETPGMGPAPIRDLAKEFDALIAALAKKGIVDPTSRP